MKVKEDICYIKTKKHDANGFVAYFSAFLTIMLIVCAVMVYFTFFDFSGHFWRGGLLLCLVLLFVFSQFFQWEIRPRLVVNGRNNVEYHYDEPVNALGRREVVCEFKRVDSIDYKDDTVVIKGLIAVKEPLRKTKEKKKFKFRYMDTEVEQYLTKHIDIG